MNLFFYLTNAATVLFIAVFFSITPALNRKSLLFGVRVPEAAAYLPECGRLKRGYLVIIAVGCLIILAASSIQYLLAPGYTLLGLMYFPLFMAGVQLAAFIPQWKKAKDLKAERGWNVPLIGLSETSSAAVRERFFNMRWGWYIASLVLSLVLALWSAIVYPSVPNRLIMHWNAQMQPDRWGNKNWVNVMTMPLIALAFILLMAVCNMMVYRQKLQVSAEYPALSFAQHKIYRRMMGRSLGFMTFCLTLMFAFMQPSMLNLFTPTASYIPLVIAISSIVGIIPVIYVPIRAGQSGCRLKPAMACGDAGAAKTAAVVPGAASNPGDDQFWKLGMFYYNPDDPSILVEDRFGINIGFNYAKLPLKIFIIVMALLLIAVYIPVTVFLLN